MRHLVVDARDGPADAAAELILAERAIERLGSL